jgi:hypothetical protein
MTVGMVEPLVEGSPRRTSFTKKVVLLGSVVAALIAGPCVASWNRHDAGASIDMFARVRRQAKTYEPWKMVNQNNRPANTPVLAWPFTSLKGPAAEVEVSDKPVARNNHFMWAFGSPNKPAEVLGIPKSRIGGQPLKAVEVDYLIPTSKAKAEMIESAIASENMKPKFWVEKAPNMEEATAAKPVLPKSEKPDMRAAILKENMKPQFA